MADQFTDYLGITQTPGNSAVPGVSSSAPAAPPATGDTDAFTKYLGGGQSTPAPTQAAPISIPTAPQGGQEDPFSQYLKSGPVPESATLHPEITHDESDRFTQDNPGDNWLEKSWTFLNKPLTETLFGWGQYRQGAGGFERGTEKILSGLTSPLSLALLAAFAPAGLAEGVAGTALKEGLTEGGNLLGEEALDGISAAQKVESYAKAVDAAKKAQMAGKSIQSAVESQGLSYQEFLNMGQYLRNQGMQETDVLGESFARRVASSGLRKAGVSSSQALSIAKGTETLVNAGFGVQQLHGAIYAYPRMMDLLSQGDYDDAAEYFVEGTAGTVFGGLGIAHGLHSIGDIVPGINEKTQLPLSDESEALNKVFGKMEGDVAASQAQIAARKRSHLVGLMEIAGVNVPAGLRERLPFEAEDAARLEELTNLQQNQDLTEDEQKEFDDLTTKQKSQNATSLGAEISSAIGGILASKADREKLADTQKAMFAALDSGNDRNLAHQKLMALAAGTHQEDWIKDVLQYEFAPPQRTLEDIANEERNAVLPTKVNAKENQTRISDLESEIALKNTDLKAATPEEAPVLQEEIDKLKEQVNDLQLKQPDLDRKYEEARAWEDPSRKEEAFRRLYEDHVKDIEEAYKSTPWDSPNAKELFYEKVRALGNYPQDLRLIEEKYPHFKEPNISPEATAVAPSSQYLFNPEYYAQRLKDPELVQQATSVTTPHGEAIAVPVGGSRLAGSLDYVYTPDEKAEAERAVKELKDYNENSTSPWKGKFPDPRVVKTGRESYEVHWGEDVNQDISKDIILRQYVDRQKELQSKVEYARDNLNIAKKALEIAKKDPSQDTHWDELLVDHRQNDLDELQKELDSANNNIKEISSNEDTSSFVTPSNRAEFRAKLYGYRPDAVEKFIDENKNLFETPDISSAAEVTKTKNFKNWFGNSKVVDENNDPRVVFHGTTKDWDIFDPNKAFEGSSLGFHAGSLDQASDFVGGKNLTTKEEGRIMPVFLSIQNPLRTEDAGRWNPDKMAVILSKHGVVDTDTSESERPSYVPISDWNNLGRPQKKMKVAVGKLLDLGREDENPFMDEKGNSLPWSHIETIYDKIRRLENEYIINLLEKNGYDGIVYKNIAEGYKTQLSGEAIPTSGDSFIALRPSQIKSAVGNNGQFSSLRDSIVEQKIHDTAPDPKEIDNLKTQIKDIERKFQTKAPETDTDEGMTKLNNKYKSLLSKLNRLQNKDFGEVHQLNDGSKIAYLSRAGFTKLEGFLDRRKVPEGTVFSKDNVLRIKQRIAASSLSEEGKKSLTDLVDKATNSNGSMVIASATPSYFTLQDRLWTIREELNHGWQYSLGQSWDRHLDKDAFDSLRDSMPNSVVRHLNDRGYKKFPSHMKVIEGAAKLMSVNPERVMLSRPELLEYDKLKAIVKRQKETVPGELPEGYTIKQRQEPTLSGKPILDVTDEKGNYVTSGYSPEEATQNFLKRTNVLEASQEKRLQELESKIRDSRRQAKEWLGKYFQAVKDKYGDTAFDKLTHITNTARQWNKEFLNANVHDTGPEPTGANVEGLGNQGTTGAGGLLGGGGGGQPPEPPEPPDEEPFDWHKFFGPDANAGVDTRPFPTEPWQDGPQHPALPANLVERVNNARARNYSPEQIDYVRTMLKAYAHVARGLSPQELELYKSFRKADDDNWAAGYNNGIIHSIVDNHIHHIWGEDPRKGYPSVEQARSGAFALNASQARHRSWTTAFEGILDGRKLAVHDPSAIIASDADKIAQASAHRKALEILSKGIRTPDGYITLKDPEGMPILVFRGMGREVPGEDGTSSSILVNPNVVKNIEMEPADVQRLIKSGLLDTYLRDGRVVDKTPQVGQGNVKEWLAATQKKIDKLVETNPLLASPADRLRHEAGWGQLQLFAKEQAQKISEYLSDAIDQIKENGPIDKKGNFAPLPESEKPTDFNMAKYLGDVLHGKNRRITPADLERLEDYAERNRNYAQGLSGKGETGLRPHEVSRLLLQEKEHLDPELLKYLDEVHDIFGQRDSQGNWSRKGLNTAIYHVVHAAENTQYPQLMKDLADLKKVDNIYTSANPITQSMYKEEALQTLKDINERQPKKYLWAPKGHITIDHPSFTGYKWMASAPDGTPTLAESDMAVSRHFYKYMVNRLGLEPSWLRKPEGIGKITEPLLRGGAQIKSTILSGSPFHVMQIALRALMLHVNPFVRPNPVSDIDIPFDAGRGKTSTLRKGVENSLTLFADKSAAEDHSVGVASHGGIISKIPIYGPFTDQIHDLLFNRFIPSVKADAYKKMYQQYSNAHPEWSDDAVAYHAAQHTNNAFGGVNWREMGRSATTQDWFNLVALAPDWLESEMRFAASLFNGYGIGPAKYQRETGKNFTRNQVAQAAVVLWSTARLLNQLYSGKPHYETPFGLVVKDKDGRDIEYSVRTLPTDILHAATDPYGFLTGRESPVLRSTQELVTGRNQYGQKLSSSEKYVDLLSNLAPIWGQAGFKKATRLATSADVGTPEQLAKAGGFTAEVSRTPAERTAANLASERSEGGPVTPAQIARHRVLLQLEDNLREGRIKHQDLQVMVDQGTLPEADAKEVIKNAKETVGLDPEQARMYSRVSRLDFAGADQVYKDSNPAEKAVLHDLLVKKARAYIKKSLKDEIPSARVVDPYFKIARRYAPLVPETETATQ